MRKLGDLMSGKIGVWPLASVYEPDDHGAGVDINHTRVIVSCSLYSDFRGHVAKAARLSREGAGVASRRGKAPTDTVIDQLYRLVISLQQYVARLDIAVHKICWPAAVSKSDKGNNA